LEGSEVGQQQLFQFGVYAGSVSGTPNGLTSGSDDDLAAICEALDELQGDEGRPLVVRAYLHYQGAQALDEVGLNGGDDLFSQRFCECLSESRRLDLVLCFHDLTGDVSGWKRAIAFAIERYATKLERLQITEEANVKFNTGAIDGDYPNIVQALVDGVVFARAELDRRGRTGVPVGFSVAPALFGSGANGFWTDLKLIASSAFVSALGYVGADFFPDVFFPVALDELPGSVSFLLQHFRDSMTSAGLSPQTPLIVTESGWPTGPNRSVERQSEVLRSIAETVYAQRQLFKILGYTWFALRDSDSTSADLFHQFGLLHSDYTQKPAFHVLKALIRERQAS
jgi:hypothetical protein